MPTFIRVASRQHLWMQQAKRLSGLDIIDPRREIRNQAQDSGKLGR